MNSAAEIWKTILTLLENEMTPTAVSTWFSEIEPVSLDENRFVLCCPTEFKRSIVSTRYLPTLERAFYELFAEQITVEVISPEERDQLAAAPAAKPDNRAKALKNRKKFIHSCHRVFHRYQQRRGKIKNQTVRKFSTGRSLYRDNCGELGEVLL